MPKIIPYLSSILLLLCLSDSGYSQPWFTGSLLSSSGKTVPRGHSVLEIYDFTIHKGHSFNSQGHKVPSINTKSQQQDLFFAYALADKVDINLNLIYTRNEVEKMIDKHIGDTSIAVGFQVLEQKPDALMPDLRISLQEIFPTGRFASLNPINKGADATGSGSYQHVLNFNFQQLTQFSELHYLRSRLNVSFLYAHPRLLNGVSAAGGDPDTKGLLIPGYLIALDLSGEYTLTKHWVAAMDLFYTKHQSSSFKGYAGIDPTGQLATIGQSSANELSIAPAIEYNFSAKYGLIAGTWFAVEGKNVGAFSSVVAAFIAYL